MHPNKLRPSRTALGVAAGIATLLGSATVSAAPAEIVNLQEWNQMDHSSGWSAERLFDREVRSSDGEDIGEVENVVIGTDGRVEGVILEVGGFLDIGDTHFMVPWDQVSVMGDGAIDYVQVPVDSDNYDQFDISLSSGDVETGPRAFRATELIGDYTSLDDSDGYGVVDDLIFDESGMLSAVVVSQGGGYGYGYRAFPYYGYSDPAFDPGANSYGLPYSGDEVATLDAFDPGVVE